MLSSSTFEFTFRCNCGWFEEEHDFYETGDEFSKRNSGKKFLNQNGVKKTSK